MYRCKISHRKLPQLTRSEPPITVRNTIVAHATADVTNIATMPMTIGFLATKFQTLVFKLFQWVSDMQHKVEDSILLVVFDAFCKRDHNMLAVVRDHVVCCLRHVQHCCIQCACMQIVSLNATCVLLSSIRSCVGETLTLYGRQHASGTAKRAVDTGNCL